MEIRGRFFACGVACMLFLFFVSVQAMKAEESTQTNSTPDFSASAVQEISGVVPNFGVVSDSLLRGGQPQDGGLDALKKAGVKTIVNLRDGIEDIESERKLAKKLGLNFVSIPMSVFKTATKKQVDQFLGVVHDPASQPVFVHCRQGMDRCGTMVAMYRMNEESWTAKKAYDEMLKYGFHPFLLGLRWSVFANEAATLSARALPPNGKPLGADLPLKPSTPIRKGNANPRDSEG